LSIYDALIVSAALMANSKTLHSEDVQDVGDLDLQRPGVGRTGNEADKARLQRVGDVDDAHERPQSPNCSTFRGLRSGASFVATSPEEARLSRAELSVWQRSQLVAALIHVPKGTSNNQTDTEHCRGEVQSVRQPVAMAKRSVQ
jgi:hypothetical protein